MENIFSDAQHHRYNAKLLRVFHAIFSVLLLYGGCILKKVVLSYNKARMLLPELCYMFLHGSTFGYKSDSLTIRPRLPQVFVNSGITESEIADST